MDQILSTEVNEFFEKRKQNFKDTDLFKILERLKVYPQDNFWIAGGSVRKAIQGESLLSSDIDCFFGTRQMYRQVHRAIRRNKETQKKYSHFKFIKNYYIEEKIEPVVKPAWYEAPFWGSDTRQVADIQLIHFKYYPSIIQLLQGFDFTVCQFGFDGQRIYYGANSLGDLMFKRLRFNCAENKHSIVNTRWYKYQNKGFKPTEEAIKKYSELRDWVSNNPRHVHSDIDYMLI